MVALVSSRIKVQERSLSFPVFLLTTLGVLSSTSHFSSAYQQKCSENEWQCRDEEMCIQKNKLCDKVNDCSDASDEGGGCDQQCTTFGCQRNCSPTPDGIENSHLCCKLMIKILTYGQGRIMGVGGP
jgi:hypothetical protein